MLTGTPAAPFLVIPLTLPGPQQGLGPSALLMLTNGSSLSPFAFSQNPGGLRRPRKHPEDRVAEHPLLRRLLVISGVMTTLDTVTLLRVFSTFSILPAPVSKRCLTSQTLPLPALDSVGGNRGQLLRVCFHVGV